MRTLEYLSPTSLKLYMDNMEDFYLRYLADVKAPRERQNQPMSIGSAFDAYAKSYINHKLFGKDMKAEFQFEAIFTKQVEKQNRDWARIHGKHVFDQYLASGALADLFLELNNAIGTPRFEFDLQGQVNGQDKTIDGVTFMGKPDIYFVNKEGAGIIFDFKVNGYCSKWNISPKPGYVCIKPGWSMHKECIRTKFKGMTINSHVLMNEIDQDWAMQLSIYSWLCGEEVGGNFITAVDQVVCNTKNLTLAWPTLRFAQHRLIVGEKFQNKIFDIAQELWRNVASGHYFSNMSLEESQSRCELLDNRAKSMWENPTEEDLAFNQLVGK